VIVLFSHFAHREGESTKLKNLLAKQEYPARAKTSLQSTGAYSELREDKQLSKMTPFSIIVGNYIIFARHAGYRIASLVCGHVPSCTVTESGT
jgi:hypothetical protein